MSNIKTNTVQKVSGMLKALSNPNRLSIFMKLTECCPPDSATVSTSDDWACACVGDLGRDLGIVASTVSHHIKELRQAGLINCHRSGQNIECSINPEAWKMINAFFTNNIKLANINIGKKENNEHN